MSAPVPASEKGRQNSTKFALPLLFHNMQYAEQHDNYSSGKYKINVNLNIKETYFTI
jgi:hypothetical protein